MKVDVAIIGGTGIGSRLAAMNGVAIHIPTEFGLVRGRLIEHSGLRILALSRHSAGHKVPPHQVNYRGLAAAVRQLGARACFATAAVGSLRTDWPAGTFALCSDFLDVSARNVTLFDRTVVHTDFTEPFSCRAREAILAAGSRIGIEVQPQAIYINGPGPRYETPHEIQMYAKIGDLVGMTAGSEAVAMREAGVDYACLAIVTNLAAGISDSSLSHDEVVDQMNRSGESAIQLLLRAATELTKNGGA